MSRLPEGEYYITCTLNVMIIWSIRFVPASSCAVSNASIEFSLPHVKRLLALDLKKQLFRIQVLQNMAASLLQCIYKEASKIFPCFGNHEAVFLWNHQEFLIIEREFKFAQIHIFHSLVSFERTTGIFIDVHDSIKLFVFFENKAEKFLNEII